MYIEEEQTTQWPKETVQKDKQRSTKDTHKTKNRLKTPLITGDELRCSGRVNSFCSTSGIRRVNLVTNPVRSHEWEKVILILTEQQNWTVLNRAHYKSANLGINGPYKRAKKVYYKSAKNLPVFLMSNYYKNNKNIIWICSYLFPMYFERHFYTVRIKLFRIPNSKFSSRFFSRHKPKKFATKQLAFHLPEMFYFIVISHLS